MVSINYSSKFLRSLKRLSRDIQNRAQSREIIFKINPFDSRLNTHKLHGADREHWAFWITSKIRIKFLFLRDGGVLYLEIGPHDEVY